jgi:hypothetical protein
MIAASMRLIVAAMIVLWSASAPAADCGKNNLAAQVAAVAADRQLARLTPATVIAKMQPLVTLTGDTATEEEWTYSGTDREAGVAWERVYFQASADAGKWSFLQLQMGLSSKCGERAALIKELTAELTKRLGPSTSDARGPNARRSWAAKGGQMISMRDGEFENPINDAKESVLLVEVVVAQGDAD